MQFLPTNSKLGNNTDPRDPAPDWAPSHDQHRPRLWRHSTRASTTPRCSSLACLKADAPGVFGPDVPLQEPSCLSCCTAFGVCGRNQHRRSWPRCSSISLLSGRTAGPCPATLPVQRGSEGGLGTEAVRQCSRARRCARRLCGLQPAADFAPTRQGGGWQGGRQRFPFSSRENPRRRHLDEMFVKIKEGQC
jgi:hypothetical protein